MDQRGGRGGEEGSSRVALLNGDVRKEDWQVAGGCWKLGRRAWEESRKLWVIVGPAVFSRIATYSMNVITQCFAGHLGDLELASVSFANTVLVGFNYGLMIGKRNSIPSASHDPVRGLSRTYIQ
ncbi:hypothetical protein ACP70R_013591 [Stipagrostis hirtigluma subsp. patula]